MTAADFIARLDKAKRTGDSSWQAKCPAHNDTNASLSVKEDRGKILVKCFAGCLTDEICRAVGVEVKDLFAEPLARPERKRGLTLAEYATAKRLPIERLREWHCSDAERRMTDDRRVPALRMEYRNGRNEVTAIRWRLALEKGTGTRDYRFLWEKGAKIGLYGLWRLTEDTTSIFLVEGESDCHTLWAAGFDAVGVPGADCWKEGRDADELERVAHIYLCVEPDKGGATLRRAMAASRLADRVKVFSLPHEIKDPSGLWLRNQAGFAEAMRAAMAGAAPLTVGAQPPQAGPGKPRVDYLALAKGFLAGHTHKSTGLPTLRYYRGSWYRWDGVCFRALPTSSLESMGIDYLQGETAAALGAHPTMGMLANLLANLKGNALCALPDTSDVPFWVDGAPGASEWMAFANATVNLRGAGGVLALCDGNRDGLSESLAPHVIENTPALFATYGQAYRWDPDAPADTWLKCLGTWLPGEAERNAAHLLCALALTPDTSYNVAFVLYGQAGTGKSTFLDTLRDMVGARNCCSVPLAKIGDKFSTWPLTETLLNIVGDMETDDQRGISRHTEGLLKDITDGAHIAIERKGEDCQTARAIARCLFACNTLPPIADRTDGLWDRLRILPFQTRLRGTEAEVRDMRGVLRAELPGILAWAISALPALAGLRRFPDTEAGLAVKQEHRLACDPERQFLEDHYEAGEPSEYVACETIYKEFREWSAENGYAMRSAQTFTSAARRVLGATKVRLRLNGARAYILEGIRKSQ